MYNIENFEIEITELNRNRMVRVYLPSNYSENDKNKYPVLYMHDGHNLFYNETSTYGDIWNAHEIAEEFLKNTGKGLIIVGVDCSMTGERFDEYSPWINENLKEFIPSRGEQCAGGKGDKYAKFLVETLKPLIDSKYRTMPNRENTFIAGSSMGGFISLYTAIKYSQIFSKVGSFSTAAWFKKDELFKFIKENYKLDLSVYLDIGTKETSDNENSSFNDIYLNDTIELNDLFISLNQPNEKIKLIIDEGATHSEKAWERRFPEFIKFIL